MDYNFIVPEKGFFGNRWFLRDKVVKIRAF
jgi:hypothetical protein